MAYTLSKSILYNWSTGGAQPGDFYPPHMAPDSGVMFKEEVHEPSVVYTCVDWPDTQDHSSLSPHHAHYAGAAHHHSNHQSELALLTPDEPIFAIQYNPWASASTEPADHDLHEPKTPKSSPRLAYEYSSTTPQSISSDTKPEPAWWTFEAAAVVSAQKKPAPRRPRKKSLTFVEPQTLTSRPWKKFRHRRKYDEVDRKFVCHWPGCHKAYGCSNHLKIHVSMQHASDDE